MNRKRVQKRDRTADYRKNFIRKSEITARNGKMIYIRPEFHEWIAKIAHVIGKNQLTLSGYIDNVLAEHFKDYEGEISRLYEENYKGLFTHKI